MLLRIVINLDLFRKTKKSIFVHHFKKEIFHQTAILFETNLSKIVKTSSVSIPEIEFFMRILILCSQCMILTNLRQEINAKLLFLLQTIL